MSILLLGVNHRTAPLEVRERFAVADPVPALAKLMDRDDVEESVLLSTCNRVELVVHVREPDAARPRLLEFFLQELWDGASPPSDGKVGSWIYEYVDSEAIRHVFRVAASIDSMVVGEPQILGQVKEAHRKAFECGASGPVLDRLYHHAFSAAKRVRTETQMAERPVSVARVAVDLALQIFERVEDKSALLVGAGEMTEMALAALQRKGLAHVRVANRTLERARELAPKFGATAHSLDELPQLMAETDLLLTSVAGDATLLTKEAFHTALRGRPRRPIFAIDLGVPRNISPAVNELDEVYLYDVDDLEQAAAANAALRHEEVERAENIVLEERQRFLAWRGGRKAIPTIVELRERAETIRLAELESTLPKLGLDPNQAQAVESLTRAIVNKLLHAPLSRLRTEADGDDGPRTLAAARTLFDLDAESKAESKDEKEDS